MKYISEFKNINNDTYKIEIYIEDGTSIENEIVLSNGDVIIEYNDDDNIFQPLKLSNFSFKIITEELLLNLFGEKAKDVKVKLFDKDNNIVWVGYATPNLYNQSFANKYEEMTVEAIDGLSILENYKYEGDKKIHSFEDILVKCIKKTECYNNIYINNNLYLSASATDNRMNNKITSKYESVWRIIGYDMNNEPYGEWNIDRWYESQYPVYSDLLILVNNNINYIIPKGSTKSNIITNSDSEVIRQYIPESDEMYNYNITYSVGTFDDTDDIFSKLYVSDYTFYDDGDDEYKSYKDVLTSLSEFLGFTIIANGDSVYILDYNYIRNEYDDYIKLSTSNNWTNYTKTTTSLSDTYNINKDSIRETNADVTLGNIYNQIKITTNQKKVNTFLPEIFKDESLTNVTDSTYNWSTYYKYDNFFNKTYFFKCFKNKDYDTFWYTNLGVPKSVPDVISYDDINNRNNKGCTLVKVAATDNPYGNELSWTDYILMHQKVLTRDAFNSDAEYNSNKQNLKMIEVKVNSIPDTSMMYDDYYIIISGSYYFEHEYYKAGVDFTFPVEGRTKDLLNNSDLNGDNLPSNIYVKAKLKIGNKYWNGTAWTTTDTLFNIELDKKNESHYFYKWFDVKNTVNHNLNIDKNGYKIPIKISDQLFGDVKIELYSSDPLNKDWDTFNTWIKDFSINLEKSSQLKNDDTDTEYLNVINNDFVNKFDDLSFTLNTDLEKGINYATVLDKPNDTIGFRNSVNIKSFSLGINQRMELNIIQNYVNQYSTPKKIFNFNVENLIKPYTLITLNELFNNEKYIVRNMSIDILNDKNKITIVEKY